MSNVSLSPSASFSLQKMLCKIKDFGCREPSKTLAVAFGVGLLINLLPRRAIAGTAAAVGATLMRPALLSLGVIKAVELCRKNFTTAPNP